MNDVFDNNGIVDQPAPEFRFDTWLSYAEIDAGLALADIEEPIVYLYNFQSWCPGCHSHGFPTLAAVQSYFEDTGRSDLVKFIAVQTVFEGHDVNTAEAAIESLERHGLTGLALAHDSSEPPTVMTDYRTGGTPWTVIVGPGPDRVVLADGFQMDAVDAIELIELTLAMLPEKVTTGLETTDTASVCSAAIDAMSAEQAASTNFTSTDKMSNNNAGDMTMTTPNDAELRDRLTPEQYQVTQKAGTERAFTGEYWDTKTNGVYRCVVCEVELFGSDDKFDSGTGWPSFTTEIAAGRVTRLTDRSHGMARTEARCASCDAHLGHVFPDGPSTAGGDRYCMNSASLVLQESAEDRS